MLSGKGEYVIIKSPEELVPMGGITQDIFLEWINSKVKDGLYFVEAIESRGVILGVFFWKPEKLTKKYYTLPLPTHLIGKTLDDPEALKWIQDKVDEGLHFVSGNLFYEEK